ncbi:NRDE-2, necessary for RNA interference-domain-containing protein [Lineolata rhizophorae]|uniref:NRDE-2, necessary for RNA interference-domain-containing protein n=1 Tax=Lineolata rhizophorae TaxID=578093 RepID=A0A6A6PDC3_9PEZI|nr:NRDE-2, necessary for RNA interference-domain-containing protein [Lineolata rhizophorae]
MDPNERSRKINAPRFASFRPKTIAPNASEPSSRDESTRAKGSQRSHAGRGRSRSREKHEHHRSHHHREKRRRESEIERRDSKRAASPKSKPSENIHWVVDKKGDVDNVRYGRPNKYAIPAYRRVGFGRIIGLTADYKIDTASSNDGAIRVVDTRLLAKVEPRLLHKRYRIDEGAAKLVASSAGLTELDPNSDFVDLNPGRKRKRAPAVDDSSSTESSSGSDATDESEDNLLDVDAPVKQRNSELTRQTNENPTALMPWLELIDHQEAMIRIGSSTTRSELSSSEKRALADIRISIAESALSKIGSDKNHQVQLHLRILEEAPMFWESRKLASRWKDVTMLYPDNTEVWNRYLSFLQTSFVGFKFFDCVEAYKKCLGVLKASIISATSRPQLLRLQVYVLVRLTSMMDDAGYVELSLAIWQALIEFHLFRPDAKTLSDRHHPSDDVYLDHFENFWDSEAPRFGEVSAKGWKSAILGNSEPPEPHDATVDNSFSDADLFHSFSKNESANEQLFKYPGRTVDTAGEDDPYHVILFSDVRDYLALLPINLPRRLILQAFLRYLRLPPLPVTTDDDVPLRLWWQDEFLRRGTAFDLTKCTFLPYFATCRDTMFSDAFHDAARMELNFDRMFIRRALHQLAAANREDHNLAEYLVAYEVCFFPHCAIHTVQELAQFQPSDARWFTLKEFTKHILKHSPSTSGIGEAITKHISSATHDHILLWRQWVWESLRHQDIHGAKQKLLALGQNNPVDMDGIEISGVAALRSKKLLDEGQRCQGNLDMYLAYVDCRVLFTYLFEGSRPSLEGALSTFNQILRQRYVDALTDYVYEALYQNLCRLLDYHAEYIKSFKRSVAREALEDGLSRFPNNTILLDSYRKSQVHDRIHDRIRTLMRGVVLKQQPSVIGWHFVVWADMLRELSTGATEHSVRALLENAVESRGGMNSIALWSTFVRFEARYDPNRAKRVYFRGIQRLPWAKKFVMLAFSKLNAILNFEEKRRVYGLLLEKELRIHVNIEGELDQMSQKLGPMDWRRQCSLLPGEVLSGQEHR